MGVGRGGLSAGVGREGRGLYTRQATPRSPPLLLKGVRVVRCVGAAAGAAANLAAVTGVCTTCRFCDGSR